MRKSIIQFCAFMLIFLIPSFGQSQVDVPEIEIENVVPIQPRNESYALVCAPARPIVTMACYAPSEPVELKQDDWTIRKPLVYVNAYNYVEGYYLWKSRTIGLGFTGSEYRYYDYPQIRN